MDKVKDVINFVGDKLPGPIADQVKDFLDGDNGAAGGGG